MVQIGLALMAIGCVINGIKAMMKGEIKFSKKKTLNDGAARVAGGLTILIGVALGLFAIFGIPYLMGPRFSWF